MHSPFWGSSYLFPMTKSFAESDLDPSARAADRAVRLLNLRDVGGVQCAEGRRVRRGRLFRSATPDFATPADVATLERLGIRAVLDLRTEPERMYPVRRAESDPGEWVSHSPLDRFAVHRVAMLTQLWDPGTLASTNVRPERFLADRYLEMCELGAPSIAECVRLLAGDQFTPALVHCTAGKDRTGVLVALLLSTLGVTNADIADDYSLSALAMPELVALIRDHTPERMDAMVNQPSAFLSSPSKAMHLFLDELASRHGSIVGYFGSIGVEPHTIDVLFDRFTSIR